MTEKTQLIKQALENTGWLTNGFTRSPFGGHQGYEKPDTCWRVSVGSRDVNFYRLVGQTTKDFTGFRINDLDGIMGKISEIG